MNDRLTLAEIAPALGKSKSSVIRRADKEAWPYPTFNSPPKNTI